MPHRLLREPAIEFRLTDDDDLQEFELFGFEVCQEPQGFERHIGQLMRFVDNEYDPCPVPCKDQETMPDELHQRVASVFLRRPGADLVRQGACQPVRR